MHRDSEHPQCCNGLPDRTATDIAGRGESRAGMKLLIGEQLVDALDQWRGRGRSVIHAGLSGTSAIMQRTPPPPWLSMVGTATSITRSTVALSCAHCLASNAARALADSTSTDCVAAAPVCARNSNTLPAKAYMASLPRSEESPLGGRGQCEGCR